MRISNKGLIFPFLIIIYVTVCASLATIADADYWMVRAFDPDESGVLEDLIVMFRNRTFEPPNYIYGTLHEYIALLYLYFLEFFTRPEVKDAIFILRLESALAGGGIILLMRLLAREMNAPNAGIYACMLLFFNSAFLFYGFNAKPELLQLLFITMSIYFGLKGIDGGKRWFLGMGVAAGLAFITKYAGLFLLPMGMLASVLSVRKTGLSFRVRLKEINIRILMVFSGFILAIAIFSPYMVRDYSAIMKRLAVQAEVNRKGFLFAAEGSWINWFPVIFGPKFLGYGVLLILGIYLIDLKGALSGSMVPKSVEKALFLALWVFFYGGYTVFFTSVRIDRYILPVLPALVLFAGMKIEQIWKMKKFALKAAILGSAALLTLPNLIKTWETVSSRLVCEASPRISAGRWLSENVSPMAGIASDMYTYVPPSFVRHRHSTYLGIREISLGRPDYIVTSKEISQRFLDEGGGKRFTEGESEYRDHYNLYRGLKDGTLAGYRLLKDFGEVQIYAKR